MIEYVMNNELMLAIIIRKNYKNDGIEFFTPDEYSQQLGYMNRPKGYTIPPHIHNYFPRQVNFTNEVLFIRSGIIKANFYDDTHGYLKSQILYAGDVILLANGGHGFEILEDCEIIEVKQGPYAGENDKTRFSEKP